MKLHVLVKEDAKVIKEGLVWDDAEKTCLSGTHVNNKSVTNKKTTATKEWLFLNK